jgi:hypothetical protein
MAKSKIFWSHHFSNMEAKKWRAHNDFKNKWVVEKSKKKVFFTRLLSSLGQKRKRRTPILNVLEKSDAIFVRDCVVFGESVSLKKICNLDCFLYFSINCFFSLSIQDSSSGRRRVPYF